MNKDGLNGIGNDRARENLRIAMTRRGYDVGRLAAALDAVLDRENVRRVRRHLSGHTRLLIDDLLIYAQILRVPADKMTFSEPASFRATIGATAET